MLATAGVRPVARGAGQECPSHHPAKIAAAAIRDALAFLNRRKAEAHKHFMLLAAVMIMDPAFGRLGGTLGNPLIGIALHFGLLAALIVHDRGKLGRIHAITKVAVLVLALRYAAFFLVGPTESWAGLAIWLFG